MTNMSIQPLWLTLFIEILMVVEFQLTKFIVGMFSYKAHFRPQVSSNVLQWCRLCIRSCCLGLRHHSCIVRSLVLVGNTRGVAWLWWYCRWCQMVLWLVRDRTYDAICSMGFPLCISIRGSYVGSIWNDSVKVSKLCIDQIKLLGFQDGLLFRSGTFECDILCYRW